MSLPPDLVARIDEVNRRADLVAVIGRKVKLRKAGREQSGLCPFHNENSPSFSVVPEKGFAHCFGCGWHGDALRFVQDAEGVDFAEALRQLEAVCGIAPGQVPSPVAGSEPARRESVKRVCDTGLISSTEAGIAVWRESQRSTGSLVERYLESRGIDPRASGVLGVVRFHPRCPVSLWRRWEGPGDARLTAPALLSPICTITGEAGGRTWVQQGVHITFLAADGNGKADLPPWQDRQSGEWRKRDSRKIWGEASLGCVPVPPQRWQSREWRDAEWLDEPGELVVAEGFESTLSLFEEVDSARGALATLSLNNLEGGRLDNGPKVEARRAMPLWDLRADPERPAFTVPDAGSVVIGVDADMKGLKERWVQERPRGKPVWRTISGAERSTICGQQASAHWRAAGARPVRVMRPPMGSDFNDVAQARRATR